MDYRKLCPKSGHALTSDERDAVRTTAHAGGDVRTARCDVCGRVVEVCVHPGTGRSLVFSMHVKDTGAAKSGRFDARGQGAR